MTHSSDPTTSTLVYVGTYTGGGSEGIYRFLLDETKAELHADGLAVKSAHPSFLALSPDEKVIFACNEVLNASGKKTGGVAGFRLDKASGSLELIGEGESGGQGTCYVSAAPDGSGALVANYGSGDVSFVPVDATCKPAAQPSAVGHHEGSSVVEKRQDAPHAHYIKPDPAGRWALAVDLGTDEIISYKLSRGTMDTSSPVVNKTPAGAGPRHLAFHPNQKFAYVANELDSTITAYGWDVEAGKLTEIESISTLPEGVDVTNYPAEVLVHPSGQYVYLSNRGHNSVAVFSVDEASGKLKLIGTEPTRGDHPRGMALHPKGHILLVANQTDGNLVVYRVNSETGLPEFASEWKSLDKPAAFLFVTR